MCPAPTFMRIARALLLAAAAAALSPARADTTRAECGFAPSDTAAPAETSHCTFSQRQGYIDIRIDGGEEFSFSPAGDTPGNFVDAKGRAVYRRSGLGETGLIFRLPNRYLYVYWQKWACPGEELADPAGCRLQYAGISFAVRTSGEGSIRQLELGISGLEQGDQQESLELDGAAYRAEVADLDANGWPEIYVYASSAGSGSYGSLVAYAVNNGKSATPVYLPDLANDPAAAAGYMGHDQFMVGENRLIRRFPVYRDGDVNSSPTGVTRQLQYRLVAGEASWILEIDRRAEY